MSVKREDIERVVASGDVAAQVELGRQMEADGEQNIARGLFASAAQGGAPEGLRLLAVSLLSRKPVNADEGIRLLKTAAEQGDGEALHLCAVIASQDEALNDRHIVALRYLTRAAEKGFALAQSTLKLLAQADSDDWFALAGSVDLAQWMTIPEGTPFCDSPRMETFEQFISTELCDWFISRAAPRLKAATVYDPKDGSNLKTDARTNTTAAFPIADTDLPLMMTQARITKLTGLRVPRLEPPVVLHYEVGEQFAPHYDFLNPQVPAFAKELAENGQRVATFLIYLNDDFEGGETDFPVLNRKFKGRKGDAILFWNLDPQGVPDERTRHAGVSPTSGEKWLFSQWLRAPKT